MRFLSLLKIHTFFDSQSWKSTQNHPVSSQTRPEHQLSPSQRMRGVTGALQVTKQLDGQELPARSVGSLKAQETGRRENGGVHETMLHGVATILRARGASSHASSAHGSKAVALKKRNRKETHNFRSTSTITMRSPCNRGVQGHRARRKFG